MSMGEFEKQLNSWENNFSSLSMQSHGLPADFSDEDIAFAKELDTLFTLDKEELPPYFVQTLLDSQEPRFQPVEHGLAHKTRAHVFRRLKLHRRLFSSGRNERQPLFMFIPARSSLVATAALVLFMFLTVMFTAPSFAAGMTILLRGASTGVKLVQNYPNGVKSSHLYDISRSDSEMQPKLNLRDAVQQLHAWNIYWPGAVPSTYTLDDTYLYQEQQQNWVDGPFIELDYALNSVKPHGTGLLAIREFKLKPNVKVLQVVKDGAEQSIEVDQNGQAQAIYVDGQWRMMHGEKNAPVWVYGQRSELIYQKDGIVFWIVGDQRDGMDKDALLKIAKSLKAFHLRDMHPAIDASAGSIILLKGDVNGPFTGDVLAISPDNNSASTYLSLGSTEQQPTAKGSHTR
ncbi:MAG: hypothetical protein NVSMB33_14270 [Ktedonobacteraceae bacterium]